MKYATLYKKQLFSQGFTGFAMLDERSLGAGLPIAWIGEQYYFHRSIGSTNDEGNRLADEGVPHGTLVVADEQIAGKGRAGKRWITAPNSGIAMSIVLRPEQISASDWPIVNAIAALAVVKVLEDYGLSAEIKWPNDVLLDGKKTAGILLEGVWRAGRAEFAVLGIGVNVEKSSLPPTRLLDYPGTYLMETSTQPIARDKLLFAILRSLVSWIEKLNTDELIFNLNKHLAFVNQSVVIGDDPQLVGILLGLGNDGKLRIRSDGEELVLGYEHSSLRPKP